MSLIFFSLSSPSAILSVQKKVSPSKCRPLLPTEELTEKVEIVEEEDEEQAIQDEVGSPVFE